MAGRSLCIAMLAVACGRGQTEAQAANDYFARTRTLAARGAICGGEAPVHAAQFVDCVTFGQLDRAAANVQQALSAGKLHFNAANAQACLDAIETSLAGCLEPGAVPVSSLADPVQIALSSPSELSRRSNPPACNAIFEGTLATGATCATDHDCQPGLFCGGIDDHPRCVPLGKAGDPCGNGSLCGFGLACESLGAVATQCVPVGTLGDSCPAHECDPGLSLQCVNGRCASPAIPSACTQDSDCPGRLVCSEALCQEPAGCRQGDGKLGCPGNLVCVGSGVDVLALGTCAAPQDVGGGCSPGPSGTVTGCFRTLLCDASTSRCVMPPTAGQACVNGRCDPYSSFCDAGSTCRALTPLGGACSTAAGAAHCEPGLACFDGTCQFPVGDVGSFINACF